MPAAAEVQVGVARIYGIEGAGTWTIATVAITGGSGLNMSSIGLVDSFKGEEIPSQNGAVVETMIGSQRRREITVEFIPSSDTTTPTRAEAYAMATHLLTNLTPYAVVALSGLTMTQLNGSWNYMGGAEITLKRDTYAIASVKLAQFATAADGSVFSSLAVAS